MALFNKKPRWIETFRLQSHAGGGRGFVSVLFWLWGIGGMLVNAASFAGLGASIGVGTSAYLAASILFWIGGMILFGIGALLSNLDFIAVKKAEEEYDTGDVRISR